MVRYKNTPLGQLITLLKLMSILSTAITGITTITHAQLSKYKHNNNTNANTTHKFIQIIKYSIKWFIHSCVRLPDNALPETMVIISKNRGTLRWNFFSPNSGFHQFLGFLPRHLTHHKCCQLSFYLCKLIILTFICNTAKKCHRVSDSNRYSHKNVHNFCM